MTHLSVNVNKLATLRNARGKNNPDVAEFARKILHFGAHGITVHPRPDARHIRLDDVRTLSALVREHDAKGLAVEFNVEGYPSSDFLDLIKEHRPHQTTLVPDPPDAITSNAGWDLHKNFDSLKTVMNELRKCGTRVSLFVEPATFDDRQAKALAALQPERIELYTEAYAEAYGGADQERITAEYLRVAQFAQNLNIGVNAGHDLNQENLGYLLEQVPMIAEVSIGHALICEALEQGMENTIHNYLAIVHQP